MTRRTICRCCGQPATSTRCEPCGADLERRERLVLSVVTQLFGSLGRERFVAALRADRITASRTRRKRKQEQPALISREGA